MGNRTNAQAIAHSPFNPTQRAIALSLFNPTQTRSHTLPSTQPKERSHSLLDTLATGEWSLLFLIFMSVFIYCENMSIYKSENCRGAFRLSVRQSSQGVLLISTIGSPCPSLSNASGRIAVSSCCKFRLVTLPHVNQII